MGITPIEPPRPIAQPEIAPIAPPSLHGARDGPLRLVVWFHPAVALPDEDEIVCTPGAADTLFGPGVAQRLLMTAETAWLQRLLPGDLAAALDETSDRGAGDVIRSTPYTHIYLLRLTGGPDLGHVCDVIGASANVGLVYPEPIIAPTGVPTQYQGSPVFKAEQAYLRSPSGINAEPAWAKGYTGNGIQAGVVDLDTGFTGVPYTPRVVRVPLARGVAASSTVSSHGRIMAGLLGCRDNASVGIGAAPEVSLVFAGTPITAGPKGAAVATAGATLAALGEMLRNGGLRAGDVVSMSLGVLVGLDIKRPYPEYAALLNKNGTAGWQLLTENDGRPSGVVTALPLEFDAAVLKLVADFTKQHITVVMSAGNGIEALCQPKRGADWVPTLLGANVGGPWIMQAVAPWSRTVKDPVGTFRRGLTTMPVTHLLDRADVATFNDGGGIVVSGGFSSPTSGMIDNIALNHGNRVDCYATILTAQALGFGDNPAAPPPGGTSLDTPVIAGVAAIVQQIVKTQFKGAVLKPALVRALLSDPDFGTPTVTGSAQVGVMPDLEKLMKFLEKPQGKRADLLTAVQVQQAKHALRMAAANVRALVAPPGRDVRNPYAVFTRPAKGPGSWSPSPLAAEGDLFAP